MDALTKALKAATPLPWPSVHQALLDENAPTNRRLAKALTNTGPALVAALESSLTHVRELEDAWRRGVLNESDGKGGTRSNRNLDTAIQIQAALEALALALEATR